MHLHRPERAILSGQAQLGGSGWITIDEIGLAKATSFRIVDVALACWIGVPRTIATSADDQQSCQRGGESAVSCWNGHVTDQQTSLDRMQSHRSR